MSYTITEEDGRVYQDAAGARKKPEELLDGGSLAGIPGDELTDADAERLGLAGAKAKVDKSVKAKLAPAENK